MSVILQGKVTDYRTRAQFNEAVRLLGHPLSVRQGSYNGSVGPSAGTHDGGGALDISTTGLTAAQKYRVVKTLRIVGFAAWLRPTRPGVWSEHIHAISVGCPDLAPAAARQVTELRNGGDGLTGTAPDPHRSMGVSVRTWEQYVAARDNLTRIKPVRYGSRGTDVKILRGRLREFITANEGYRTTTTLDPHPVWDVFDKPMSALIWQAHKTLARKTGNKGWRSLRNDIPGESLLNRLGLTAR